MSDSVLFRPPHSLACFISSFCFPRPSTMGDHATQVTLFLFFSVLRVCTVPVSVLLPDLSGCVQLDAASNKNKWGTPHSEDNGQPRVCWSYEHCLEWLWYCPNVAQTYLIKSFTKYNVYIVAFIPMQHLPQYVF